MNKLNYLRQKVDELLQNSTNDNNECKKYTIIKEVLKDDDCFLNIDIEHAYAILRDLGIEEERLRSYYSSLILR